METLNTICKISYEYNISGDIAYYTVVLLHPVSVTHGQPQFKNIKQKIPEIVHEFLSSVIKSCTALSHLGYESSLFLVYLCCTFYPRVSMGKNCIYRVWASLVAQLVKNPPAMQKTLFRFLGWEDPLEKEQATQSSILVRRIPWTIQSMGLQKIEHDSATFTHKIQCYPQFQTSTGGLETYPP